jgi:hypothetical protein
LKLSHLAFAAGGYVLGARAGRDRYDQIVSIARRIAGSQTVQSTAGLVQGRLDYLATHARQIVAAKIGNHEREPAGDNGFRG